MLGALPVAALAAALGLAPRLVPPAPLRISAFGFEEHAETVRATVQVAAPVPVPVHVTLRWERGAELLRASRDVSITAHGRGFRVWDELVRSRMGAGEPGVRLEVLTATGQLIGARTLPADPAQPL